MNVFKSGPVKVSKWVRRDWLLIALIGLLLQGVWALQMEMPSYMDAYYYTTNGQRLAEGFGFTEEIVWQYLDQPQGLPAPSHTYWMPLPSIVAAAGYTIFGGFRGAQFFFWLLAGLLPLLTYAVSLQFTGARWQVWAACLFTATGGYYSRFLNQPSTFALFAWMGGVCLLFLAWGCVRQKWYWWLLAGITAGLAHLTRADGVLLLVAGGWVWLFFVRDWWRARKETAVPWHTPLLAIGLLVAGYLLVMTGWFIHSWLVTGRPLSAAGTQTVFLTTYDDIFAYGRYFDLAHYLSWGWGNIIQSKLTGLSLAVQSFIAVNGLVFLFPFVLLAWWSWGRQPEKWALLRPFTWYALGLFIAMSLIFTFPGQRGGLLHSSVALWSWCMVLATAGIDIAVDWVAQRRTHWQPARAKPIFSGLFWLVALVISVATLRAEPDDETAVFLEVASFLPETAVVMTENPPSFYYHTGLSSIYVPNEPPDVMLQAAHQFNVTYLILDEHRPKPLGPLYEGEIEVPGVTLLNTYYNEYKLYALDPTR